MNTPASDTPRRTVRLRALEPTDLDLLYELENDSALWADGTTLAPFSRRQLYDYIATYSNDIYTERQLRLMAVDADTGQAVGMVDLTDFEPADMRAQVGLLIVPAMQGRGYGRAALQAAMDYCRGTLQLHQLWALVAQGNDASMALFRGRGFRSAGRLRSWLRRRGSWRDAIILQHLFG